MGAQSKKPPKTRLRRSGPSQRKLGKIGGRCKLSQIDVGRLIDDIARGVAVTIACAAQGIHRDTFYSWLDEQPEFAHRLAAAKRDVIVGAIAGIRTGSKDDEWRGHAWFLEHVYPDHYAPPAPGIAFGVQQNFTITIEKAKEIEDQRARLLPEVHAMLGLPNGKEGVSHE
jgi:hypothetical protein